MTARELNKAIKNLYSEHYRHLFESSKDFFKWWDEYGRLEFERLYKADPKAELLTLNSYKAMQRLNQSRRAIPFHIFYIQADPQY